jgi:hypothetical protein
VREEIWRDIPWAPKYEVSNDGRVRNVRTGRILKYSNFNSRSGVGLMVNGELTYVNVSRLVQEIFGHDKRPYERWRIVECAWDYEVSDQGRVRNLKTGRILKPYKNCKTGLEQVTLMVDGYRLTRSIRKLMEEAFD